MMIDDGSRQLRIVVGYDGSGPSRGAVRWAAREASRRGRPLDVVHVVDFTGYAVDLLAAQVHDWPRPALDVGRAVADEGLALAREEGPDVTGRAVVESGAPSDVLVQASRRADVVVVGSRGRGDLAAGCLGSVSTAVAAHALSPVVIVRDEHPPEAGPSTPVVAAVDGSLTSGRVAEAAAAEAVRAGAPLRLVTVWTPPPQQGRIPALPVGLAGHADLFSAAARRYAQQVADRAAEQVRRAHPGLEADVVVVEGRPGRALVEAAEGAALLVVGSRGRGAFSGLLLGSVSHEVAHTAGCPVMVVRAIRVPAAAGRPSPRLPEDRPAHGGPWALSAPSRRS